MSICRVQWVLWGAVALLGVLNLLSACGSKGDLYLPPAPAQTTQEPQREPPTEPPEERRSNSSQTPSSPQDSSTP